MVTYSRIATWRINKTRQLLIDLFKRLFTEGKVDEGKNFVTPDVVYHGLEDVRGLEDFKKWIIEERKSFPDMQVTIVEDIAEGSNVAVRWTLKATHERDFAGLPASHKKLEAHGVDIFHFEMPKSRRRGLYLMRSHRH